MGSSNGLVPSGNKPLPEPMLTQIYVTMYGITRAQWINMWFWEFLWTITQYLLRQWPKSLSPYGITRPQWVKMCFWEFLWTITSYLFRQWSKSMSPYSITRLQWVKMCSLELYYNYSRQWIAAIRLQAITWTNVDQGYLLIVSYSELHLMQ